MSGTHDSSQKRVRPLAIRYAAVGTQVVAEADEIRLTIPTDEHRAGAGAEVTLVDPALARDALLTMAEILTSDHRFKAGDRSDYLAYLLKQGKRASKELWEAQKKFLESRYAEEVDEEAPLDPLLTVTDDEISIEVFSADESSYARLAMKNQEAYTAQSVSHGTTHIDLASAVSGLSQLRSHRAAKITFSSSVDSVDSSEAGAEPSERRIKVPYRWVRALGQMQAASTMPSTSFELAPIDLYNVLFTLRTQRAKTSPRALRYELVPGQPPRIVLEPWDLVLESSSGNYEGNRPGIVRTWGRRRLSFLARLLPRIQSVTCHLIGAGLPAFYVFDLGPATLTLALSGWTDAGWAGISTFDLFGDGDDSLGEKVVSELRGGAKTLAELAEAVGSDEPSVRNAVLASMQGGDVVHDFHTRRFHFRPLFEDPIDPKELRFRDANEEAAHRLLEVEGQVRLTTVHDLGGEGTRIEGEVEDAQAHRVYLTSFTIDREGRTVDAKCTSPQFRRAGLREGPTIPMIALRIFFARQRAKLEAARDTEEGRKLIRAETRMLIRREASGSTMMRISLSDKKVVVRWGPHPEKMRMSQQVFSSADDARSEYFNRLSSCADRGYIDASAAEAI